MSRYITHAIPLSNPPPLYPTNAIRTAKYTIITFIPKNLYEQFRRVANFFFLFTIILQCFPQFKTISVIVSALPLILIVVVTMLKDGIEDWKRWRSDRELNQKTVSVLEGPNYNYDDAVELPFLQKQKKHFKSLIKHIQRNGLFAQLKGVLRLFLPASSPGRRFTAASPPRFGEEGRPRPARGHVRGASLLSKQSTTWLTKKWKHLRVGDQILLHSNDALPADILLIASSNEDGVAYVETKNLDGETNLKVKNVPKLDETPLEYTIETELPNVNMNTFKGTLILDNISVPLSMNELLLRGSNLKNTDWIIGIVIYTGEETKQVMNAGDTPSKRSKIERKMNMHIISQLVLLFVCCMIPSIYNSVWVNKWRQINPIWFDDSTTSATYSGFIAFWLLLIMFQNLVPISVYITVEVVKVLQASLIWMDNELLDEKTGIRCIARTWNLSDDLGQIDYIFSDKTGTLTQNVMVFKKCSILDQVYETYNETHFESETLMKALAEPKAAKNDTLHEFWLLLAVCHTVLVQKDSNGVNGYCAQSPDEAALVDTAKLVGYEFIGRDSGDVFVTVQGERQVYTILNVLEFNSDRKRMTVIVRKPDGKIVLYCKGADSTIIERCAPNQDALINLTTARLEEFAETGLRTLCLAKLDLTEEQYTDWGERYHKAQTSLQDKEKECDILAEEIEKNLILLGSTAIEDKLQDGVPEAIVMLKEMGIKLWVLTGDKVETAINIGFLCNLLRPGMDMIVVKDAASPANCMQQLSNALQTVVAHHTPNAVPLDSGRPSISSIRPQLQFLAANMQDSVGSKLALAIIVDGKSLAYIIEDKECRDHFLEIALNCQAVLCCRVSPLQKAQVVDLIRSREEVLTLAIGDGANDVGMIQAADIGVGISGLEGLQAAMSSDYSIAQFRYLVRLLLIHGKWSYLRVSNLILGFFAKNIIWSIMPFWYSFYNGGSGQQPMDFSFMVFYNVLFTLIPVGFLGIFDRDFDDVTAMKFPGLYASGRRYSHRRVLAICVEAAYMSVICYFLPYCLYGDNIGAYDGTNVDMQTMGASMAMVLVFIANILVTALTISWSGPIFFSFVASCGTVLLFVPLYGRLNAGSTYLTGVDTQLMARADFWFATILIIMICLLPRTIFNYLMTQTRPADSDIIHEMLTLKKNKDKEGQLLPHLWQTQHTASSPIPDAHVEDAIPMKPQSRKTSEANAPANTKDSMPPPSPLSPSLSLMSPYTRTSAPHHRRIGSEPYRQPIKRASVAPLSPAAEDGRRDSIGSFSSVVYDVDKNTAVQNRGFGFSQSKGVSGLILRLHRDRKSIGLASPELRASAANVVKKEEQTKES